MLNSQTHYLLIYRKSKKKIALLGVILLLTVLMVFLLKQLVFKHGDDVLFDESNISFEDEGTRSAFRGFVDEALTTQDQEKRSKAFSDAFLVLAIDYDKNPSEEKRELLIEMNTYLQANDPEIVKKDGLSVPCKEESCGAAFLYDEELSQIKNSIVDLDTESNVKESLLHNLENAAMHLGAGKNSDAYNALRVNFGILKVVWDGKQAGDVKALMGIIETKLESLDPERYEKSKARGFFTIEQ